MADVVLLDTSIPCELLGVPGKSGAGPAGEVQATLESGCEAGDQFLLPWTAVIETGNHVGQVANGSLRRQVAERFVTVVQASLDGAAPWTLSSPVDAARLRSLLHRFPEWATSGSGLGDLTIVDEFDRQCRLNPSRRVWIWSLDRHLSSYDRRP